MKTHSKKFKQDSRLYEFKVTLTGKILKKKTHNKNKNTMTCFFKKTTFYNGMPLQQAAAKVM